MDSNREKFYKSTQRVRNYNFQYFSLLFNLGLDYDYIEFQQTPIESESQIEEQSKNSNSTTEIKGPRDVIGTQNGTKSGTAVPPVPARTFEEAEIVNSRGYKSLMPESPEDYIKSFSTRQGEM